jgi:SAM-dependent methyltransferase
MRPGIRRVLKTCYSLGGGARSKADLWALKLALKLGAVSAYQPIPDVNIRIVPGRETAVRDRWEAIRPELPPAPASVLDIGCNMGFYVVEAAKLGYTAAGLDKPIFAAALATISRSLTLDNVIPIRCRISPETIAGLPSFDCVIMLQVFHHLCYAHGEEQGLAMLRQLYDKAGTRFIFETEASYRTSERFRSQMPDMGDDAEAWVKRLFTEFGCRETRTIYRDEGRERVIVAVDK